MKILSDELHAVLDYATVVIFALAPTVVGFSGVAEIASFVLAAVHLAMTLVTDMPFSVVKIVPLKLHALVELVVGPVLLVGGLLSPISSTARTFYVAMGIVIFLIWLLSSYGSFGKRATSL